ncbi:MAG: glycosyltransferase family 39 protein, partial [Patescibacteria group bacterium]
MQTIKKHKFIILIILLAAFLRLYGLSHGDTMNDESLMAFRSIGLIDFDEAAWQTTPFEWFDPLVKFSPTVPEEYKIGTGIPWWAHLSWHDHPPLVFLVQNIFISIFGEHAWAFRLPSAILGVISVYFIYLIGNLLWTSD